MRLLFAIAVALVSCGLLLADDYSFEIPEEEEEEESKLEWSGNLDERYFIFHADQSSPFYQLQFSDKEDLSDYFSQYRVELYLDADYQTKDIGFYLKTHSTYYNDSEASFDLLETYGNVNLSLSSFIQAGKRMYRWGKGYAFNPVGYVNPFKDPENPELAQAGLLSVGFEKIKSLNSDSLKTIALTAIVIPPEEILSNRYGELENTDFAAKGYFLLWDIDIDVIARYSKIGPSSIGADFATNIRENIELHGELSHFKDTPKNTISEDVLLTTMEDGYSYLLGLRYLNQWQTTVIAEYYHNGAGLTDDEYGNYIDFLQNSVNAQEIEQALQYSKTYFRGGNLMQDYLYIKAIHPEPFGWLYFTPSLFTIYNINDNSFMLAVPLNYKPFTNFELMFCPTFLIGDDGTEFASRQFEQKYELRMKLHF
ncbi:hypothetical protein ACFL6S_04665 [Candidatus Poribacteria bacterium]